MDQAALLINFPLRSYTTHERTVLPVTATLVSVDRSAYLVREEITYELVLRNTGARSLQVPTSAKLHLFTSTMPGAVRASFWLEFQDDLLGEQAFAYVTTFGSRAVAGSLIQLEPDESLSVRAAGTMSPSPGPNVPAEWLRVVDVGVGFALYPVAADHPYGRVQSPNRIAVQIATSR